MPGVTSEPRRAAGVAVRRQIGVDEAAGAFPARPLDANAEAVAAGVEADVGVLAHGVVREHRQPEQGADGRDGADLAAGCESCQLGLREQSNVARTEGLAGLAQVEVVCGVEDGEDVASVICHDADDFGEGARIDPLGRGGGAGRECWVVLVDLVLDVLAREPVEEGCVWPVEDRTCAHLSRSPALCPNDLGSRGSSLKHTGHWTR